MTLAIVGMMQNIVELERIPGYNVADEFIFVETVFVFAVKL